MTPPPLGPMPGEAHPQMGCTTSLVAPIADSALAAYQLAGVAYVATLDDSRFGGYPISRGTDMALGGVLAAAFAGSAVYGYWAAGRCRRIQQGPPGGGYLPGISELAPGRQRHD